MEESSKARSYFIDIEGAGASNRSLSVLIAARKCYACRQGDTDESVMASDPQDHMDRIVEMCSDTADYLRPDTPIREAIFRVLLAGGNEPQTAEQVSASLSERWAISAYPRDISPTVIGRILDHSETDAITAVPEPEPPEPEDEDAPEDIPGAEADETEEGGAPEDPAGADEAAEPEEGKASEDAGSPDEAAEPEEGEASEDTGSPDEAAEPEEGEASEDAGSPDETAEPGEGEAPEDTGSADEGAEAGTADSPEE